MLLIFDHVFFLNCTPHRVIFCDILSYVPLRWHIDLPTIRMSDILNLRGSLRDSTTKVHLYQVSFYTMKPYSFKKLWGFVSNTLLNVHIFSRSSADLINYSSTFIATTFPQCNVVSSSFPSLHLYAIMSPQNAAT